MSRFPSAPPLLLHQWVFAQPQVCNIIQRTMRMKMRMKMMMTMKIKMKMMMTCTGHGYISLSASFVDNISGCFHSPESATLPTEQ